MEAPKRSKLIKRRSAFPCVRLRRPSPLGGPHGNNLRVSPRLSHETSMINYLLITIILV